MARQDRGGLLFFSFRRSCVGVGGYRKQMCLHFYITLLKKSSAHWWLQALYGPPSSPAALQVLLLSFRLSLSYGRTQRECYQKCPSAPVRLFHSSPLALNHGALHLSLELTESVTRMSMSDDLFHILLTIALETLFKSLPCFDFSNPQRCPTTHYVM